MLVLVILVLAMLITRTTNIVLHISVHSKESFPLCPDSNRLKLSRKQIETFSQGIIIYNSSNS